MKDITAKFVDRACDHLYEVSDIFLVALFDKETSRYIIRHTGPAEVLYDLLNVSEESICEEDLGAEDVPDT